MNATLTGRTRQTRPVGFNVIGHVSGNLGLGVLARNLLRLLQANGFSFAIFDVDPGAGRGKHDLSFERFAVEVPQDMPFGINLLVLPPPSLQFLIPTLRELLVDASRMNVALPMWELLALPPLWREVLEFFDVLVAGSPFIRSSFELNLSGVFSVLGPLPIFVPAGVCPDRARFGLPKDPVVFLAAFEPYSDSERKNPAGVLEAFSRISEQNRHAMLAFKVNNSSAAVQDNRFAGFLERASAIAGVKLLTSPYSYKDVLDLYASVDVVVSLHRSEGVGLVPQEAMTLGKPVIATAWSGNMGYMSHTNACLVDYELVPVQGSGGIYEDMLAGSQAKWAEPNLKTAATWMERLAADEVLRSSYGMRAKEAMDAFQAGAMRALFLDELLQVYRNRGFLCKGSAERESRLKRLRRKNRIDIAKRRVRARLGRGLRSVLQKD